MRYFNVLLFVGFAFANIHCMENSSNSIMKATEPLSQLRLCDLPLEILDYIASFLTFPYEETDEEFERRLRTLKKEVFCKKITPVGKVFYSKPAFYLNQNDGKAMVIRLTKWDINSVEPHAFSSNNKYLLAIGFGCDSSLNRVTYIDICDIGNKKRILQMSCNGVCQNFCAITNNGRYFAILGEDVIAFFQVKKSLFRGASCSWKEIILPPKTTMTAVDFNKQSTKLGYIIKEKNEEETFMTYDIESKPFRKTLTEYFRQKGICEDFTLQTFSMEIKKSASVLKKLLSRFR